MSQNTKFAIFISYTLVYLLIFGGCSGVTSSTPNPVPTLSHTMTHTPTARATTTATPALNTKTFIITPDDLFSIPGLEEMNTPSSADFCEHIPPPEVVESTDKFSLFSGRFSLCIWTSWQFLVDTVMDLDRGTLVSADNLNGDIAMAYRKGLDVSYYYVIGLNNAHIDEIETTALSYSHCESLLQSLEKEDPGILIVHKGAIACVMTTEGRIALVRVEHIYPLNTQGVEFSYAILKKE